MANPNLVLVRAKRRDPITHWRPISHVEHKGERLKSEQLADALSGNSNEKPIKVEDPYNRRRLMGKFVIEPLTQIVRHRDTRGMPLSMYLHAHPLALIWPHVQIDDEVTVGSLTEVRQYSRLKHGAMIGDRSIVGKQTFVGKDAKVGSAVFIGSYTRFEEGAQVGIGSVVEQDALVRRNAILGMQTTLQRGTRIGEDTSIDDSAKLGRHVHVGREVLVGEGASISHFTVIGDRAIIGAGASIGEFNVLQPTAWILADAEVPSPYAKFAHDRYRPSE